MGADDVVLRVGDDHGPALVGVGGLGDAEAQGLEDGVEHDVVLGGGEQLDDLGVVEREVGGLLVRLGLVVGIVVVVEGRDLVLAAVGVEERLVVGELGADVLEGLLAEGEVVLLIVVDHLEQLHS